MAFDYQEKLLQGNRRALAKAITLTESSLLNHKEDAQELLDAVLSHTGKSIRIGITGIPGVGKSTFIESFGLHLISQGKKVAVLAVDPSSPLTGGSILGDKTRMEILSQNNNAFIRPSPSSGALGGVAQKTREAMLLCEAAGYDVIIVETVGVGQSEYQVSGMVDFFLVLMLPNAGDELQGIKKGILELADAIIVNKADGESVTMAKQAKRHYENALHLMQHNEFWQPRVMTCSGLEKKNVTDIWSMISEYYDKALSTNNLAEKRNQQNMQWMKSLVYELLEKLLDSSTEAKNVKNMMKERVITGQTTPFAAANAIVNTLKK